MDRELKREFDRPSLQAALKRDHAALETRFARTLGAMRGGESELVRSAWLDMEADLGSHMRAEEEFMLPLFERALPHEAARIRREHAEIRRTLEALGVELDLHALTRQTAERFMNALRDHAQNEEQVLYQWVDTALPSETLPKVFERLRALAREAVRPTVT